MYRLYRKMAMNGVAWIQHGCLSNIVSDMDPSNSVIKMLCCIM